MRTNLSSITAVLIMSMELFISPQAQAASTVISMPPPPRSAPRVERPVAEEETASSEPATWLERAARADLAGTERSYLGVVAMARFAQARNRPRYTHFQPYNSHYFNGGFSHVHPWHFPFDVSFFHSSTICGVGFPWFGFHKSASHDCR